MARMLALRAAHASIAAGQGLAFAVRAAEQARFEAALQAVRDQARAFETDSSEARAESLAEALENLAYASRVLVPPDPDKRPDVCQPRPVCPHRGGDKRHNECADREPPNALTGCDVRVSGKNFDALTAESALWEVKTAAWSYYGRSLKRMVLAAYVIEAGLEHAIAKACGYPFVFAVADDALFDWLREELANIEVRHVPRCRRR